MKHAGKDMAMAMGLHGLMSHGSNPELGERAHSRDDSIRPRTPVTHWIRWHSHVDIATTVRWYGKSKVSGKYADAESDCLLANPPSVTSQGMERSLPAPWRLQAGRSRLIWLMELKPRRPLSSRNRGHVHGQWRRRSGMPCLLAGKVLAGDQLPCHPSTARLARSEKVSNVSAARSGCATS